MEEVKFIKTGDDFSNIAAQLKQECVEYLTQVTKENGSSSIWGKKMSMSVFHMTEVGIPNTEVMFTRLFTV